MQFSDPACSDSNNTDSFDSEELVYVETDRRAWLNRLV